MNSFNWKTSNDQPEHEGRYLVEFNIGDDVGTVAYAFDDFRNGRWGYAQFVNRWLDISKSPEFWVIKEMPREFAAHGH